VVEAQHRRYGRRIQCMRRIQCIKLACRAPSLPSGELDGKLSYGRPEYIEGACRTPAVRQLHAHACCCSSRESRVQRVFHGPVWFSEMCNFFRFHDQSKNILVMKSRFHDHFTRFHDRPVENRKNQLQRASSNSFDQV
jgi:hypothetical protein